MGEYIEILAKIRDFTEEFIKDEPFTDIYLNTQMIQLLHTLHANITIYKRAYKSSKHNINLYAIMSYEHKLVKARKDYEFNDFELALLDDIKNFLFDVRLMHMIHTGKGKRWLL